MQEWLPENHLARFVVEIVEQLDFSKLTTAYRGRGSDAFHPSMMVALLFYGYATGVFSSRKLERETYDSVAFRYVAANRHPDHIAPKVHGETDLRDPEIGARVPPISAPGPAGSAA